MTPREEYDAAVAEAKRQEVLRDIAIRRANKKVTDAWEHASNLLARLMTRG